MKGPKTRFRIRRGNVSRQPAKSSTITRSLAADFCAQLPNVGFKKETVYTIIEALITNGATTE
jgi:hypothetical protein